MKKKGGQEDGLILDNGLGPWRSMSVYFLILPSSFIQCISVSV
jgi:hypothetical protein